MAGIHEFPKLPTEQVLFAWRYGATQSERLCAELLIIEGFEAVDPQCPIGGPDGLKDVVCKKNNLTFVAAAFFPSTPKTYSDIEEKFNHDLEGVSANNAAGLVFFTNQRLSPGERNGLQEIARGRNAECVIYHLERIRALLDAPRGYGIRLEYLRIPMSSEEQLGYFGEWKNDFQIAMRDQRDSLQQLAAEVDSLRKQTMTALGTRFGSTSADLAEPFVASSDSRVSQHLTLNLILMVHRAACIDIGTSGAVGSLRQTNVWIGKPGEGPELASFKPPDPDQLAEKLSRLVKGWNDGYEALEQSDSDTKITAIARFHHEFVSLHPFLDGNGRVARILLSQQIIDLFGPRDAVTMDQGASYYAALQNADARDFAPLRELVSRAVNL